jgi:2'-5' RNA ligase
MVNRWRDRQEPAPGEQLLYWHLLLRDYPQIQALTSATQKRLATFSGLHLTPQRWLHITIFVAGPADNFTSDDIRSMTTRAGDALSRISPIRISLSKILYHPEAIVVKVDPGDALVSVRDAVRDATRNGNARTRPAQKSTWVPHITLAYSTTIQPMHPIIATLGHTVPACEASINSISLVAQEGAERLWNWHSIAEIPFGPL